MRVASSCLLPILWTQNSAILQRSAGCYSSRNSDASAVPREFYVDSRPFRSTAVAPDDSRFVCHLKTPFSSSSVQASSDFRRTLEESLEIALVGSHRVTEKLINELLELRITRSSECTRLSLSNVKKHDCTNCTRENYVDAVFATISYHCPEHDANL